MGFRPCHTTKVIFFISRMAWPPVESDYRNVKIGGGAGKSPFPARTLGTRNIKMKER
jgi:hypothetical protein